MYSCIFLFPNALISASNSKDRELVARIPQSFQELCLGADEPSCVRLFNSDELDGFATNQWLWMTITARTTLLESAPYLWKGLGGYRFNQQVWRLTPYHLFEEKLIESELILDEDEECFLMDSLNPILRKHRMQLQLCGNQIFATRKPAWDVLIAPWESQKNKPAFSPEGTDAKEWMDLFCELRLAVENSDWNQYRKQKGFHPIDGLWICSGGVEEQILPMTQLRTIQSDSPLVRGIADASGLQTDFITTEQDAWPDCAPGSRLVVFDEFSRIDRFSQPDLWLKAWELATQRITRLVEKLESTETYQLKFVATDGLRISTLTRKQKISKLLFWKNKNNYINPWLLPEN